MRIAVDIEDVKRMKKSAFTNFLTEKEKTYVLSKTKPEMHACAIFCSKEVVKKLVKKSLLFKDIEIRHDDDGSPLVFIKGKRKQKLLISISHTNAQAVAMGVLKD